MKQFNRRHFLKAASATAAVSAVPLSVPAPATLLEAGAGLCLVLAVAGATVVAVVRLCRPKYILYFSVDESKTTNAGRTYICLSCSRAEVEQRELTRCQGKFTDQGACQAKATLANSNYLAVACGPIASTPSPPLRASITVQTTHTPADPTSWLDAAPAQIMDLNDPDTDDPSVTFTLPLSDQAMFFRASAQAV